MNSSEIVVFKFSRHFGECPPEVFYWLKGSKGLSRRAGVLVRGTAPSKGVDLSRRVRELRQILALRPPSATRRFRDIVSISSRGP